MRLNSMSPDEVEERHSEIVGDIALRAQTSAVNWWQKVALFADRAMSGLGSYHFISSWLDEAVAAERAGASELIDLANVVPPAPVAGGVPRIDLSNAIRHMTYHVWPMKHHDVWRWNLRQISQRWKLFNGRKVLGIVYNDSSHGPDEVLAESTRLGITWDDVVVHENIPVLGEVVTWHGRLAALDPPNAGANEVVFAAHAKGVRHAEDVMVPWVTMLYEICLDDWDTVRQQLEWGLFTGPFQQVRDATRWHYSGSYYWFRLRDIGRRKWKRIEGHYSGTETWPWLMADRSETGCLFARDCGDLYTTQQALWDKWKAERHARTSQSVR